MATRPSITVKFRQPSSSTTRTFTANVISGCNWTFGKQQLTDSYQGNTCQVFGINPANVTEWPQIGATMSVVVQDRATPQGAAYFVGVVTNVEIQYGLLTTLDTFTISVESPLSRAGRQIATLTTTAGASTYAMADSINALTPMNIGPGFVGSAYYANTTSAQTITQTILDHINLWERTEQGIVSEYGDTDNPDISTMGATLIGSRLGVTGSSFFFGDGSTGGSGLAKYSQIVFQSAADNYSTKVLVDAAGFAQQEAGTGTFTYELDTINGSAAQAKDVAGYVQTILELNQRTPTSFRYDGASNSVAAQYASIDRHNLQGEITFRGTTYRVFIQGGSFSANASNWEAELYVSSAAYAPWLVLDSTIYGIIGTNKLGL